MNQQKSSERSFCREQLGRGRALPLCLALACLAAGTPGQLGRGSLPIFQAAASSIPGNQSNPAGQNQSSGPRARELEARLAETREGLAAILALEQKATTNLQGDTASQDLALRRAALQRLVHLYEQQISSAAELEAAKTQRAEAAREAENWAGFPESRPYSIRLVDFLREEIQNERLSIENGQNAVSVLDQLTQESQDELARAEEALRQINEGLETAEQTAARGALSSRREVEQLRSEVSAATLAALEWERQVRRERLAAGRIRLGLLQRQLISADAGADFSRADLEQALAGLQAESLQLERELAGAQARREAALRALEQARGQRSDNESAPGTASSKTTVSQAVIEARRAQLELEDTTVNTLRMMLETKNAERLMWEWRFATHHSRDPQALRNSQRSLNTFVRRVNLWRDYLRQQLSASASEVSLQEARVSNLPPGSELSSPALERLAAMRERDQSLLRASRNTERLERLAQRWNEGLQESTARLPFFGRVRNLFAHGQSVAVAFWNFELLTAEDTITVDGQKITGRRGVTIGKIVAAVLILVIGYWVTGLLSRIADPLLIRWLKVEKNQGELIRRWVRAFLLLCLVVFSLVSVKIPLTIFAFAGGALAIGLGFGTQTILKNIVSGIIILFERPFRVGDVLDVAGFKGTVSSIGFRASVLQLWDGTESLIPNSTLLESNLTNWTYSNRTVRFTVSVGVAYGSDTRRVTQLLTEIVERHGLVEKYPKPQVLFTDFGDSALNFEVRFWVDVQKASSPQVSSDLRQMIATTFSEHGIQIPFPQRDLHLDASHPILVEVVTDRGNPTLPPTPSPQCNSNSKS
jgi:potassium-dependent mechanosensitive channel